MKPLPTPGPEAVAASHALVEHIRHHIETRGGWISFADYMRAALYTPALGYYSGGAAKFGAAGDFVTAPLLTPLFGACVARSCAAVLAECGGSVLETGAGTGELACQILGELERLGQLPEQYLILDLSGELRARQAELIRQRLPHLAARVAWLNTLPAAFTGVIVGNEVLDAMPCEVVQHAQGWQQRGVVWQDEQFGWENRPLESEALKFACEALPATPGFTTEVQLEAQGFIRALAASLKTGLILLFDYGFEHRSFYHPQRHMGTLIGHYRHHTVHDPFFWPGLTDLTCHIDFSSMYWAAEQSGLCLDGYTNQSSYLIDTGILQLAEQMPADSMAYLKTASALQKLLGEAEMGELFKAIAFSRGLAGPTIPGFRQLDRSPEL